MGLPVITGTAEEYGTLRANVSNIKDPDGIRDNQFTYQWLRSGTRAQGATTNSYRLTEADVGHRLAVRVTYHDENDNRTELDSALTDPVTAYAGPSFERSSYEFEINENIPYIPGFGEVRARSARQEHLVYSLDNDHGGKFAMVRLGNTIRGEYINLSLRGALDYETAQEHRFNVRVTDSDGRVKQVPVTVKVQDEDESGSVWLTSDHYSVGKEMQAFLIDIDAGVTNVSWQWSRTSHADWLKPPKSWTNIQGATQDAYTLTEDDRSQAIRVTVNCDDGTGTGHFQTYEIAYIRPANFYWHNDGQAEILTGGRVATLPGGSNPVEQGDRLAANVPNMGRQHGVVGNPEYEWTLMRHDGVSYKTNNSASRTYSLPDDFVGGVSVYVTWLNREGNMFATLHRLPVVAR